MAWRLGATAEPGSSSTSVPCRASWSPSRSVEIPLPRLERSRPGVVGSMNLVGSVEGCDTIKVEGCPPLVAGLGHLGSEHLVEAEALLWLL